LIVPFIHQRTVCLNETDAAGVVYFANLLVFCHQAYEASLAASGIDLHALVTGQLGLALPLSHSEIDFWQPVFCGDRLHIHLTPQHTQPNQFDLAYQLFRAATPEKPACTALTRHVCIHPSTRQRQDLPEFIQNWLAGLTPANP
jgi:1,4-dihydroxy-2-naphthoyl-CoA hydrolase